VGGVEHIVEKLGREFANLVVEAGMGSVKVVEDEADEVAKGSIKTVLDFVLSAA
jgi:hypothetical protein